MLIIVRKLQLDIFMSNSSVSNAKYLMLTKQSYAIKYFTSAYVTIVLN